MLKSRPKNGRSPMPDEPEDAAGACAGVLAGGAAAGAGAAAGSAGRGTAAGGGAVTGAAGGAGLAGVAAGADATTSTTVLLTNPSTPDVLTLTRYQSPVVSRTSSSVPRGSVVRTRPLVEAVARRFAALTLTRSVCACAQT